MPGFGGSPRASIQNVLGRALAPQRFAVRLQPARRSLGGCFTLRMGRMLHSRDLVFFISSTADLRAERDAVETALRDLSFDGARFEAFPSIPALPMQACLDAVRDSNAFILVLGRHYGTRVEKSLSATHVEFRHAKRLGKPIFAFVLHRDDYESDQQQFIREVEASVFRCARVANVADLQRQIKRAIAAEAARRWNVVDALPPESAPPWPPQEPTLGALPAGGPDARAAIQALYTAQDDRSIVALAEEIQERFKEDPEILSLLYAAEVNAAMAGLPPNRSRVLAAIAFWGSDDAVYRWSEASRRFCQGNAYSVLGDSEQAVSAYRAAVSADPDLAQCWKNLGTELFHAGDTDTAKECFERALSISPRLFEALYSLGTLQYSHLNDAAASAATFSKIDLRELPLHQALSVLGWRAIAELDAGAPRGAVKAIGTALRLSHETEWLWLTAGRIYAIGRRVEKSVREDAANFWPQFVRRFPAVAGGWEELGLLLFRERQSISYSDLSFQCEHALEKAIALGSEDALVWDRLGHLYQERDDWAAAEEKYRFAAAKDAAAHGECLASALIHLEQYADALPWAESAAIRYQRDARSWTKLAECYQKLRRSCDAESAFKTALDLDSSYEFAWFNLGGFYWNAKRRDEAVATWAEAIRRFPESSSVEQVQRLVLAAGLSLPSNEPGDSSA